MLSSVTYSSQLHHVIRSLKQLTTQEVTELFKNSKWFESWSLSASEGQAVTSLFAQSTNPDKKRSGKVDLWG
ncbi:hypothetical protein CF651_31020 [Paenibacillus rigui]|uniref:Uncharacterized protein n=1 Tax=Paenibacillus rigui TaxID=554312 RepID=A0A229UGC4_9BACL|nr:hypothetical protein CF651_31020 [Paenibacillus rigui]